MIQRVQRVGCLLVAIACVFGGARPAVAALSRFTALGPPQGCLDDVRIDSRGRWLVATSAGGVFVSSDRGARWAALGEGLADDPPRALAVGRSASELYAAGAAGFQRSRDGGLTWQRLAELALDLEDESERDLLAFSAGTASAPGTLYLARGHRLLRSRDGGEHFVEVLTTPTVILSLAVDPTRPARVFVGLRGSAIGEPPAPETFYATSDAGAHWRQAAIFDPAASLSVDQLAYQPSSGTLFAIAGLTLFRSDDLGNHWQRIVPRVGQGIPTEGYAYQVFFHPRKLRTVYAVHQRDSSIDLLESPDLGGSWRPLSRARDLATAVLVDFDGTRLVYHAAGEIAVLDLATLATRRLQVAAGRGSYRCSGDAGAKVRFLPGTPETVFVTTGGALWTSRDRGTTWSRTPEQGFQFGDVATREDRPAEVLAATSDGLKISFDGARTFSSLGADGEPLGHLLWLDSHTLVAGYQGVSRSTNGGTTLVTTLPDLPEGGREGDDDRALLSLAADPASRTLFASTLDGFGRHFRTYQRPVFRSVDQGATWQRLPLEGRALAIARAATGGGASRLYLWREATLEASLDGGASWQTVQAFSAPAEGAWQAHDLLADPRAPGHLWAACSEGGVLRSTDGGLSFRPVAGSEGLEVYRLFAQEDVRGRIWAVTDRGLRVGRFALE